MLIGIFYSQIVESSSLVSVLFREVFSHPYISFFHLLVNGFSVTCIIINYDIDLVLYLQPTNFSTEFIFFPESMYICKFKLCGGQTLVTCNLDKSIQKRKLMVLMEGSLFMIKFQFSIMSVYFFPLL